MNAMVELDPLTNGMTGMIGGLSPEFDALTQAVMEHALGDWPKDVYLGVARFMWSDGWRADMRRSAVFQATARTACAAYAAGRESRDARVAELEAALLDAAEWFQGYGHSHFNKGDTDKATRNFMREAHCRAALKGGA